MVILGARKLVGEHVVLVEGNFTQRLKSAYIQSINIQIKYPKKAQKNNPSFLIAMYIREFAT